MADVAGAPQILALLFRKRPVDGYQCFAFIPCYNHNLLERRRQSILLFGAPWNTGAQFSRATTLSDDRSRESISYTFDHLQQLLIPLLNVHPFTPACPRLVFIPEQNHAHSPSAHEAVARYKTRS
jgi:hypothetical protein